MDSPSLGRDPEVVEGDRVVRFSREDGDQCVVDVDVCRLDVSEVDGIDGPHGAVAAADCGIERQSQYLGDLHYCGEADGAAAVLEGLHAGSGHPCQVGEGLLGQTKRDSPTRKPAPMRAISGIGESRVGLLRLGAAMRLLCR